MKPILALDWGEKRIGVAFSEGFLASPHSVIFRKSKAEDYARIANLVAKTKAEVLVIGLPKSINPEQPIGPQAKSVLKHRNALAKYLSIPIKMMDETFSTVDAHNYLNQRSKKKKKKVAIDAAAAAVILQRFLDSA